MTRSPQQHRTRRGSVYLIVLATAIVVSVIGLSAIIGVRSQFRMGDTEESVAKARVYAQSALELVLLRLALDTNWRAEHTNDEWVPTEHVGELDFTYKLTDDENVNLTDDPTAPFRLHTKASVGNAIRRYSVMADMGSKQSVLKTFVGAASISQDELLFNKWWAQYFKPTLPADATGWWVTSVELIVRAGVPNRGGAIRLYEPLDSNMPSGTLVDEVLFNSNNLPAGFEWVEFKFPGNTVQDPDDGLCLALTTPSPLGPLWFEHQSGAVTEPDSGFITGTPAWSSFDTDKSMRYRIHGVYITGVSIVPTTWQREID